MMDRKFGVLLRLELPYNEPETKQDEFDSENWKADFNKAVSGLLSMISAQVLSWITRSNRIERKKVPKGSPYMPTSLQTNCCMLGRRNSMCWNPHHVCYPHLTPNEQDEVRSISYCCQWLVDTEYRSNLRGNISSRVLSSQSSGIVHGNTIHDEINYISWRLLIEYFRLVPVTVLSYHWIITEKVW